MLTMAWRNLWRNRRRTLITLASISFGIFLAATMYGLGNGKYAEMIGQSVRMGLGDVTVEARGYLAAPSLRLRVDGVADLRSRILSAPGVRAAYPRLQGPGLFSTANRDVGGLFMALDPGLERTEDNAFLQAINAGALFRGTGDAEAVCGDSLARKLKLRLGQKLVVSVNDVHGQMSSILVRLCGTFHTGVEEVDATALLLPMGTAADMVGCGRDQASALAVMVDDDQAAEGTALALPPRLGRKDIEVESWKQTMPQVDSLISVDRVSRGLVMLVLGLMIAMGVLNTSLMSVIERRREFGVMLALGLSPFRLIGLVLAESAFTALLGLGGGALVSIPWAAFLHFHGIDLTRLITKGVEVNGALFKPVLRAVYDGDTVLTIVSVTLALVLGAGLYPAWKAGRVPPMEAIREN